MKLPKNFCIAPFTQLTTHPNGSSSPCPYLGGTVWRSADNSLQQQWLSEDLDQLRQQFKNNQRSDICQRCWFEEDNNKRSLRLRMLDPESGDSEYAWVRDNLDSILHSIDSGNYRQGPQALTLKNGNVCNARCRTCQPGDSSRWIEDANKLSGALGQQFYAINQREQNWTAAQIDDIVRLAQHSRRIELFGGEPGYNKRVYEILRRIVELGTAADISLYINTNGSVDIIERCPEILEFGAIEIGVSIDGVSQQFDYLRNGLDYTAVIANVVRWRRQLANHNHSIDAITTVNAFNVYYLPEIKRAIEEILPLPPFWNLLRRPEHLFIANIPTHAKKRIQKRLSADPEFDDIVSVLDQPADPLHWQDFLTITAALDQIRGENWQTTFKEFADCVNSQ